MNGAENPKKPPGIIYACKQAEGVADSLPAPSTGFLKVCNCPRTGWAPSAHCTWASKRMPCRTRFPGPGWMGRGRSDSSQLPQHLLHWGSVILAPVQAALWVYQVQISTNKLSCVRETGTFLPNPNQIKDKQQSFLYCSEAGRSRLQQHHKNKQRGFFANSFFSSNCISPLPSLSVQLLEVTAIDL